MGKRNAVPAATVSLRIDELTDEQAWQLAQFCKRITFASVREVTDGGQSGEQRDDQAYVMLEGINAVARALRDKGYAPR